MTAGGCADHLPEGRESGLPSVSAPMTTPRTRPSAQADALAHGVHPAEITKMPPGLDRTWHGPGSFCPIVAKDCPRKVWFGSDCQ